MRTFEFRERRTSSGNYSDVSVIDSANGRDFYVSRTETEIDALYNETKTAAEKVGAEFKYIRESSSF